jgi:WD40 repeat protein
MWDLPSIKEVAKLQGHQTKCTCIYSDMQEQSILVTGSEDTKAKVWDLRQQKCIFTFREHTASINCI